MQATRACKAEMTKSGKVYLRVHLYAKRKDEVINTKESGGEHDPAVLISRCARL